ncbi:MAG: DUF1553 domain-containing protein [Planctomycetota bacterium]
MRRYSCILIGLFVSSVSGRYPPARYFLPPVIAPWLNAIARADAPAAPLTATQGNDQHPKDVLALFKEKCVKCHGPVDPKGSLELSSFATLARGVEGEPVVIASKATESRLWHQVEAGTMPPPDEPGNVPLTDKEQALIREWIESGAAGLNPGGIVDEDQKHWSFRPVVEPPVPAVAIEEKARTDVDRFLLRELENRGLGFSEEADRSTLIRRVSFDLTGLPPTPTEIAMYLADPSDDAYERMVESYLASPRYGERWGKLWLDASGYADSNGYFNADSGRPLAYKYRDYVVRSFNADKPMDQFVREQIAGDELANYRPGGDVTPEMVELLTATHFLRNAQDGTGESDGNPDELRADRYSVLEGNLQVIMSSLVGVTIQCARCHSHKFEPIRHEEYYQLQAILFPAYCPDRWKKPNERVVEIGTRAEREEHARRIARVNQQIEAIKTSLAAVGDPLRKQLREERLSELPPKDREAVLAAFEKEEKSRSAEEKELVGKHEKALKVDDKELNARFPEYARFAKETENAIAAREKERPAPLEQIAVLVETDPEPMVHHRLERGLYGSPAEEVAPGVPVVLTTSSNSFQLPARSEGQISTGRRLAFAHWLTSPDHPMFARVLVNRLWKDHFGTGIVATVDNLGMSGAPPSHPELLDFLASHFVKNGWSTKGMHRLILASVAYRQKSQANPQGLQADPEDRLLWRYPPRRLDAEAVRDSMLAVAGQLDLAMGGPFVPSERSSDGSVVIPEERPGSHRRSLYIQQRRTQVVTMLELFDAPVIVTNCTARGSSTVPLQSLALLNSEFSLARAKAFADRLFRESDGNVDARLSHAFLLAVGRGPTTEERTASRQFVVQQETVYSGKEDAQRRAWNDFCQMLLASNAFLYVE